MQALQHVAAGALILSLGVMLARYGEVSLLPAGWADAAVLGTCRWVDASGVLKGVVGSGGGLCVAGGLMGEDGMGWRGPLRGFGEPAGGDSESKSWLMEVVDEFKEMPGRMLGLDTDGEGDASPGDGDGEGDGDGVTGDDVRLTSPLVLRSGLSFLLWWVCTAWFFASLLGLFYWEVRRVTMEVQGEEATEGGAQEVTEGEGEGEAEPAEGNRKKDGVASS